ncbi:hypothetical protein [Oceanobacillus sp. CF4.6]|uniref:hypothetical protein n=1 Tax=Oceanobacillus sp. CF4.6 TaxID=3373080 RepID=UPI003EE4E876
METVNHRPTANFTRLSANMAFIPRIDIIVHIAAYVLFIIYSLPVLDGRKVGAGPQGQERPLKKSLT